MNNTRRWLAGIGAGSLLLIGGVVAGPLGSLAQSPTATASTTQQPAATQASQADNQQQPSYTGSIPVPQDNQTTGEADEAAALQTQAKITASQAEQTATAANPGTTAKKAELDNENGYLVYSVELSNGMDVKVDAGNGKILATEQPGAEDAKSAKEAKAGAESSEAPETDSGR